MTDSFERKDNYYAESMTIDDIRKLDGIPDDVEVVGYVIHLPDKDEFVGKIKKSSGMLTIAYVAAPHYAKVYKNHKSAIKDAKLIIKHKLMVCALLESSNQYVIHSLWSNH